EWSDASLILIDIPIGLPNSGDGRACDAEARLRPGRRRSSVFTPPGREALRADLHDHSHKRVSDVNREETGKGLSIQAFGIVPKIREVDELLRERGADARPRIREVHPEVCFWSLNRGNAMQNRKSTKAGLEERLTVLRRLSSRVDLVYNAALETFLRKEVARDDILDATAAAVTAVPHEHGIGNPLATLPVEPPRDAFGLPMEMAYRVL
ncbi:MAG: DUF429 domain-containing protein, partial [Chloroflexi bacterium]|nr:DUF429 domain-containing protein [Chloroflexota bacterium]